MYQHPSDWHNDTGVIRQAEEQAMGIVLMRPLTSGVFQRLMAEAFPEIDVPDVDLALVDVHEPRFVDLNGEMSDDVTTHNRLAALFDRHVWQAARTVKRAESHLYGYPGVE